LTWGEHQLGDVAVLTTQIEGGAAKQNQGEILWGIPQYEQSYQRGATFQWQDWWQ